VRFLEMHMPIRRLVDQRRGAKRVQAGARDRKVTKDRQRIAPDRQPEAQRFRPFGETGQRRARTRPDGAAKQQEDEHRHDRKPEAPGCVSGGRDNADERHCHQERADSGSRQRHERGGGHHERAETKQQELSAFARRKPQHLAAGVGPDVTG
jgi:hypothetical protein